VISDLQAIWLPSPASLVCQYYLPLLQNWAGSVKSLFIWGLLYTPFNVVSVVCFTFEVPLVILDTLIVFTYLLPYLPNSISARAPTQTRLGEHTTHSPTSGGSKIFEMGAEDNLSDPSSFIASPHNEINAFYTEKTGFLKKI